MERTGKRRRFYLEFHPLPRPFAQGLQYHACGIGLSVGTVARNMRRAQIHLAEQALTYVWFMLPGVDDSLPQEPLVQRRLQCLVVHHLPPAGVDEVGTAGKMVHKGTVGQMKSGPLAFPHQWSMKRQDIRLLLQLLQRAERHAGTFLCLLAWRVVKQQAHSQGSQSLAHSLPHMPHAHDSHRGAREVQSPVTCQQQQTGTHVLPHRGGIAPWRIHPRDACLVEVSGVQMVIPDGGRSDEAHPASLQQLAVTACTGAHNQSICIPHILSRDGCPWQIAHFVSQFGQRRTYKRDFIVYNYSHASQICIKGRFFLRYMKKKT